MQTRILGFVQICHCDQRRHSMEQCIEQPGNALAWSINCSMLAGSSRLTCSLHKRITWRPCSAPTFPKLESLSQANSKRTLEPFNECRPFNCRASLVVSSCGWAVAPRLPVTPPWFNDSLKMAWTHSRDKNEHASLATSATTDRPATDERSGGSSCSSLLSGGHWGTSSSDNSSLMDGDGETSNLSEINASSIVGKDLCNRPAGLRKLLNDFQFVVEQMKLPTDCRTNGR